LAIKENRLDDKVYKISQYQPKKDQWVSEISDSSSSIEKAFSDFEESETSEKPVE
jgi:hypothetical protein